MTTTTTQAARTEDVARFFDRTDVYLRAQANIRVRTHIVQGLLGETKNSAILDVGCGDGSLSACLGTRNNSLTLVDLSSAMLSLARERLGRVTVQTKFVQGDFLRCSLPDAYDVVICLGVLAHVESIDLAVGRIAGLLKPGGRCVLQWSDSDCFLTRLIHGFDRARDHAGRRRKYQTLFTRTSEIIPKAQTLGLQPLRVTRYVGMLPGMGLIPVEPLTRCMKRTIDNPLASAMSTEVIALFVRSV